MNDVHAYVLAVREVLDQAKAFHAHPGTENGESLRAAVRVLQAAELGVSSTLDQIADKIAATFAPKSSN